jgi:phage shock protein A
MEAGTGTKGTAASMSVMKRVTLIFRSKANKALDRMEDPRETLDYSYQRQLEMLQKVRRGVADVATSRKRVELQMNQIQQQSNKLEKQARDALGAGREDLAREALTRRSSAQSQLSDLQAQYASLQAEEEKLTVASQRLQSKVDAFRTRKETIKATYTAAEAQTRINEAFSGISEEMGDVGMAIQRAEDKTAQMQARAGAIDELLASGALEDVSGTPRDDIQAELDRMGAGNDVELELQKLRGELGSGSTPELEAGPPGGSDGNAARNSNSGRTAPAPPQTADGVQPPPGNGAATAGEPTIPASDVGESAIPSADPPRTSDQP